MSPTFAQDQVDAIAEKIVERMKQEHHTLWIDPEMHAEQHKFLRLIMEERAEFVARRKAVQDKIAGSLILSFILALVGLIGAKVLDLVRGYL